MILVDRYINEMQGVAHDEVTVNAAKSMREIIADARRRFDASPPDDPIRAPAFEQYLKRLESVIAEAKEQP